MALTEQEEKQLKDGLAAMSAQFEQIKPVLAEVPVLKSQIAAKDAEIADLKNRVAPLTVNSAAQVLKTAYPDVPEATLMAAIDLPADKQKAILEPAQKAASGFKATMAKTDPTLGWADAGSIEATTDAERLARDAERRKAYQEHQKSGNLIGMLEERGAEIAAYARRAFAR